MDTQRLLSEGPVNGRPEGSEAQVLQDPIASRSTVLVKFKSRTSAIVQKKTVAEAVSKPRLIRSTNSIDDEPVLTTVRASVKKQQALFSAPSKVLDTRMVGKITPSDPVWVRVETDRETDVLAIANDLKKSPDVLEAQPEYGYSFNSYDPSDPFFRTDLQVPPVHSWGQTYADQYNLKITEVPEAWTKLYEVRPGDCDGNGVINEEDLNYLIAYIYHDGPSPVPWLAGDANGDRRIDNGDMVALVSHLSGVASIPLSYESPEIVVAVVDTGVDMTHEDISNNLWTNPGEIPNNLIDDDGNGYIDDIHGWSFGTSNSGNVLDTVGHGTHVAGIIAASTDNALGVSSACPSCKVMAIEARPFSSTALSQGLLYAAANGARIINASWGSLNSDPIVNDALDAVNSAGVLLVFASGNFGNDANLSYPNKEYLFTVSATDPTDSVTDFSSFGSRIDVAAPGLDILSLRAIGRDLYGDGTHVVDGKYYRASGTSMAAPLVAAIAGLVLTQHPALSAAEVRSILRSSATDIETPQWDYKSGHGRVNATAALDIHQPCVAEITSPKSWMNPNSEMSQTIEIRGSARCTPDPITYNLEMSNEQNPGWTNLAAHTGPIMSGLLDLTLTNSQVLTGRTRIRLRVTDPDGREYADIVELKRGPYISTRMPASPLSLQEGMLAPKLADLSPSSAGSEILFGMNAFDRLGAYLMGWPNSDVLALTPAVSRSSTSVYLQSRIGATGMVYRVRDREGGIGFESTYPELASSINAVRVVDMNPSVRDGDETLFQTNFNLFVTNSSGVEVARIPCSPTNDHAFTTSDVDGDGEREVVLLAPGSIEVVRMSGERHLLRNPADNRIFNSGHGVLAADLDQDGRDEILYVDFQRYAQDRTLHVMDGLTGVERWTKLISGKGAIKLASYNRPAVADLNHDGYPEIAIPSNEIIYLVDRFGNDLPGWPIANQGFGYIAAQPLLVNLDSDDEPEILFSSFAGLMNALNVDGSIVSGYPITTNRSQIFATPAVGDIDGDGKNEIVVSDTFGGINTQLLVFETEGSSTKAQNPWPQSHRDAQNSDNVFLNRCSDRTLFGQCNSAHQFCDGGELVEKCWVCGCPDQFQCVKKNVVPRCEQISSQSLPDRSFD